MKLHDSRHQEMPEWIPRAVFTVIASIGAAVAAFWFLGKVRELLTWLLIALFLSFALEPLTNRLQARGWKRGTATGFILFGFIIVFLVFLGSMVPLVVSQVKGLLNDSPRIISQITDGFSSLGVKVSTQDLISRATQLSSTFGVSGGNVASNVLGVGGRLVGGVFQLLTIALFAFYLVVDGPKLRRKIMTLLPPRQQQIFLETWEVAIEKMGGYLYVRLILAGITAASAFVVMTIAGIPFALPLALWMGIVSQFIPVIGTYIAAAVPLLVALLESPISALVLIIYVVIYQQIENYVISPKLTARTMQLHPAIAIGSAIAGGSIGGPVGAFLALPAAAIFQVVFGSYIKQHEVVENPEFGRPRKKIAKSKA